MEIELWLDERILLMQHLPLLLCLCTHASRRARDVSRYVPYDTALTVNIALNGPYAVVLGTASLFLFSAIVLLASSLIIFFVPSLATPSYTLETQSLQQFLMTPVSLANRIIYVATRIYDVVNYSWWWGYTDDGWEPLSAHAPPTADRDVPRQVGILATLLHRFVLGLSAVGSLSFISWIWQMRYERSRGETCSVLTRSSLLGPFRFRPFRGNSRNRRNSAGSVATILVLVFIIIGVARSEEYLYLISHVHVTLLTRQDHAKTLHL